jgi:tripartite-type tricarboxylate transporter receptor subunit TctC
MSLAVSRAFVLAAAVLAASASATLAQSAADFYKGKQVSLLIGTAPGGGYDAYARILARHMDRHIPGRPTFVPKNMPGASSLLLANHLYNVAPKDGLSFGALQRGLPLDPLYTGSDSKARFDATKFTWLGSMNTEIGVGIAAKESGITKFEDLKTKELIVGSQGGGVSDTELFPRVINEVLGTKMRIVTGYKGSADALLAMERLEVGGHFSGGWTGVRNTVQPWLDTGKAILFVELSVRKSSAFPDLPLIMDFAETEEQKQVLELVFAPQLWGRPFAAPPELPADRATLLKESFMATLKDPQFLEEAKKLQFDVDPISGDEMGAILRKAYASPEAAVAKVRRAITADRK